jgi:uncharacterized Fe-S cluster-containing radical SAM superfamily protein
MKAWVSSRKRGSSAFRRSLWYVYSVEAASKSCSSCTFCVSRMSMPKSSNQSAYLEQVLFVAERLFLLVPQFGVRIVVTVIVDELARKG